MENTKTIEWKETKINVDELKPASYNPRKITPEMLAALKLSMQKWGLPEPLAINQDMTVIGGHQRLQAAKELGWVNITCKIPDRLLTDLECKELNIAFNKIDGEWDLETLPILLKELQENGLDPWSIGMNDNEIKNLLNFGSFKVEEPDEPDFSHTLTTEHKCPKCGYEY